MRRILIGAAALIGLIGIGFGSTWFYQRGQETAYLEQGQIALEMGRYEEAIVAAYQGLAIRPDWVRQHESGLIQVRSQAHIATENWGAVISDFEEFPALLADDQAYFTLATAHVNQENWEAALSTLEQMDDPTTAEVRMLRGQVLLNQGDIDGAYRAWQSLSGTEDDTLDLALRRLDLAELLGEPARRIEAAEGVLFVDSSSDRAGLTLVDLAFREDRLTALLNTPGNNTSSALDGWQSAYLWLLGDLVGAAQSANPLADSSPSVWSAEAVSAALASDIDRLNLIAATAPSEPDAALAIYLRGKLWIEQGRLNEALADADLLLQSSYPYWGYVLRGDQNIGRDAIPQAIFDYDQALAIAPEGPIALFGRAHAFQLSGDLGAASADLASGLAAQPDSLRGLMVDVDLAIAQDDLQRGLNSLTQILDVDPTNQAALHQRSMLNAELGNFESAIIDDTLLLELTPNALSVLKRRGESQLEVGNFEAAIEDFSAALVLDSSDADLYIGRSRAYRELKILDSAVLDARRALQFDDGNALAYLILGQDALENERFFESVLHLSEALEIDDTLAEGFGYRSEAYFFLNEIDRARADANEALNLNADLAQSHMAQTFIHAFDRDWRSAIDEANQAVDLAPEDPRILANRGLIYLEAGDYNRALDDFSLVIDLEPDDPTPYLFKAEAEVELQRYEDALSTYEAIALIEPDATEPYLDAIEIAESRTVDILRIPEAVDGARIWQDQDHGFAIRYPAEWLQFVDPGDEFPVSLTGPLDKDYRANVDLFVLEDINLTVSQLSRAFDPPSTLNDFEELENRSVLIGGRSAIRKTFSWTALDDRLREVPITVIQIYMISNGDAYLFTATMRSEDAEKYEPIFNAIFDTFEFISS